VGQLALRNVSALMPNDDGVAVCWYYVICIKFNRCKLFGAVCGLGLRLAVVEIEWSTIICSNILICESKSLVEHCGVTATGWTVCL
jgi:hypothetical protein